MKRKIPTLLIIVMISVLALLYWKDLSLNTDPVTGFVTNGTVWFRYVILAVAMMVAAVGLISVGPRGIAALRMRSNGLGLAFLFSAACALLYGASLIYSISQSYDLYSLLLGVMFVWYGVWATLAALQMFRQRTPAPTKGALWGLLAALPFCLQTVYRVLVKPASLHRIPPLIRIFAALFTMLWVGMLLRALYIALVRSRSRWMYLFGLFTFLFTSLELAQTVYDVMLNGFAVLSFFESLNMFAFGVVAVCVSVSIAGKGTAKPPPTSLPFTEPYQMAAGASPLVFDREGTGSEESADSSEKADAAAAASLTEKASAAGNASIPGENPLFADDTFPDPAAMALYSATPANENSRDGYAPVYETAESRAPANDFGAPGPVAGGGGEMPAEGFASPVYAAPAAPAGELMPGDFSTNRAGQLDDASITVPAGIVPVPGNADVPIFEPLPGGNIPGDDCAAPDPGAAAVPSINPLPAIAGVPLYEAAPVDAALDGAFSPDADKGAPGGETAADNVGAPSYETAPGGEDTPNRDDSANEEKFIYRRPH